MTQTSCPNREQWRQFQRGLITDQDAEPLELHLGTCPTCVDQLSQLPTDDPLLTALRAPAGPIAPADATPAPALFQRLKDLYSTLGNPGDTTRQTPVPASPALPAQIGRYQVQEELGAGGMGVVYRAYDPSLARLVAIKVPRFDGSASAQERARKRFLREARAAAQVRHPHICPIHDVGEVDQAGEEGPDLRGRPFVVMDFIAGQSLQKHLERQGRFVDPRRAVQLVRLVAEALEAVHQQGIVHRDLKPGNILLDAAGQPYLTDFGLARMEDDGERLTGEGPMPGTPAYMAPEQIDPALGEFGPRSDVYSLGVVFYQMLAGQMPFRGTIAAVLNQITSKDPPSLGQLRPELSPSLLSIVQRAMARRPDDRHDSAAALATALARWEAGQTTQPSSPTRPTPGPSPFRPRRLLVAGVLAGLLLTAAVGVLAMNRSWWSPRSIQTTPTTVATDAALRGSIDVRVWEPGSRRRQDVRINQETALPLRPGDQIRIEVELNRPAYVYVIMIETTGEVTPVYPWKKGKWELRPGAEAPVAFLSLPEEAPATGGVGGFKVALGTPGMETLVLLVCAQPLPADFHLGQRLGKLPEQKEQSLRAAVWFENAVVVRNESDRAFASFDPERIDDPVLQTQQLVWNRLRGDFPYIRAVSYAVQGE